MSMRLRTQGSLDPVMQSLPESSYYSRVNDIMARWRQRIRPLQCPECESTIVSRSVRHGFLEKILKSFGILPWRCLSCRHRFFGFRRKVRIAAKS
jgi:hypothetical protein